MSGRSENAATGMKEAANRGGLQKGCCDDFERSENGIGDIKAGANAVDVLRGL